MDVVKTMRYKFVRYCVNKAYAEVDLKDVPAELLNLFDDVVNQIRDLERYFTSVDAIVKTLRADLPDRLRALKERSPELASEFARRVLKHCNELDEVVNSPVGKVLEEALSSF